MNLLLLAKAKQAGDERVKQRIEEEKRRLGKSIQLVRTNSGRVASIGIDDFDFIKKLGEGGFGKVYLVCNKKSEKLLALKAVEKSVIIGNHDYEITKTERNVLFWLLVGTAPSSQICFAPSVLQLSSYS